MDFKTSMGLYGNWNGTVKVNDGNLDAIAKGCIGAIMHARGDLHGRTVAASGFYGGRLAVRLEDAAEK